MGKLKFEKEVNICLHLIHPNIIRFPLCSSHVSLCFELMADLLGSCSQQSRGCWWLNSLIRAIFEIICGECVETCVITSLTALT